VVVGAKLDDSFMAWNSETVYQNATTTNQVGIHSYHAMCIVGYDNNRGPRGAFKVVNSWSKSWGAAGFIWVDYNFMVDGFSFNKNFFVAVNDDQKPEDNGNPSSTRVNVFFSNTQWSLAITFGFIWVTVYKPELIISYLGVMAALVAGLLGLKVWQKDKEQSSEKPPEP
jgi:hypothetical protein